MVFYFLIGLIYALLNREPDKSAPEYALDIFLWPYDILKNFWIGWNKAKDKDKLVQKANIKLCQDTLEEFHNTLSDTVLLATGKKLNDQPEHIRQSLITYEIQAALAAARNYRLNAEYHRDFAAATLARGGIPKNEAFSLVDHTMNSRTTNVNGREAYQHLILGPDRLKNHVQKTLENLSTNSS